MSDYDLFVYKAKNASAKFSQKTDRWFIRFDDAHAKFTSKFMNNLSKATSKLRSLSKN